MGVLRLVVLGRQPVSRMNRLILLLCLVHPSFQGQLFHLKPDVDTRDIKPCNDTDAISCIVAEVDVSSLQDGSLDLPQDLNDCSMDFKNDIPTPGRSSRSADQTTSTAYEAECGEAVVSIRGGRVMADIHLEEDRVFVLEPCKAFPGCHVLKEEANEASLEEADFELREDTILEVPAVRAVRRSSRGKFFSNHRANKLRQQGKTDNTTVVSFSVKFYYTLDFAETFEGNDQIDHYFDKLTALTNQGFINSKIPVRMKIFCIEATKLRDIKKASKMLSTFENMKGSKGALRGSADAATLLLKSYSTCGNALLNSWRKGLTVTTQTKFCALKHFVFGHELGHNFGCAHDRVWSRKAPYKYAYGHFIGPANLDRKGYRTIQTYGKRGYKQKINYYSNPDVMYKGYPTGTEENNCARVIRENRFGMAAVGDESGTCTRRYPVWCSSGATSLCN